MADPVHLIADRLAGSAYGQGHFVRVDVIGWLSYKVVDQLAAMSASRFVGCDDHPFGRNQTVNQLEVAARSAVIEEAATLAEHEWVDEQHIPVNELRCTQ